MNRYNHVVTLLYWDMHTGVPKAGFDAHADAVAYFSVEELPALWNQKMQEYLQIAPSKDAEGRILEIT